ADQILADYEKNPMQVPFEAVAQALATKGRWTEALVHYVSGLEAERKLAREFAEGLRGLVAGNPRLRLKPPAFGDPIEAENRYGAGIRAYYAGQYREAERQLN